jgi:hypothetical protein
VSVNSHYKALDDGVIMDIELEKTSLLWPEFKSYCKTYRKKSRYLMEHSQDSRCYGQYPKWALSEHKSKHYHMSWLDLCVICKKLSLGSSGKVYQVLAQQRKAE